MITVLGQWFMGGKTNICYNAVDRNIEAGNGGKVAMIWEGNEVGQDEKLTYSELLEQVCQVKHRKCATTHIRCVHGVWG
jgi:acetyl-CoA synthetase